MNFFLKIFNRNKIEVNHDELVWRREKAPVANPAKRTESSQIPRSLYQSNFSVKTTQQFPQKLNKECTNPQFDENNYQINFGNQNQEKKYESNTESFSSKSNTNFYRRRALQLKQRQTNPPRDNLSGVSDFQVNQQNSHEPIYNLKRVSNEGRVGRMMSSGTPTKRIFALPKSQTQTDNFLEIEKRVSRRLMSDEAVRPQGILPLKTSIFDEPSVPSQKSARQMFSSQTTLPSEAVIEARPNTGIRKLQIFEKMNLLSPTKPDLRKKPTAEIQDFDCLLKEHKKLNVKLGFLENQHSQQMKDPRNMNVQENTFKILMENVREEERKRNFLLKDKKLLENEVSEKRYILSQLYKANKAKKDPSLETDFKEKEKVVAEIEKVRSKIMGMKLLVDNFQVNSASNIQK